MGIFSSSDFRDECGKKFIFENIDASILENTIVSDDEQVKLFIKNYSSMYACYSILVRYDSILLH
jgi:hypothetical protein